MVQIPVQKIAAEWKTVPPEFVVSKEDQVSIKMAEICVPEDDSDGVEQIPLIDLSPLLSGDGYDEVAAAAVRTAIGKAAEESGFFQIVQHGVPEHLLDGIMKEASEFFDLPPEKKLLLEHGAEKIVWYSRNLKSNVRPWSDALNYRYRTRSLSSTDGIQQLKPTFREMMDKYSKEIIRLARLLTCSLSEYYGLEPTSLQEALESEPNAWPDLSVVCNFYPSCPHPELVYGLRPHADAPAMTILLQDEVAGLEMCKNGKWFRIKPRKDALVVNIGNQLEILTNGRVRSAIHRAVVNNHSRRISIAAFSAPAGKEVAVGPLNVFVDDAHPPLFGRVNWMTYIRAFHEKGHDYHDKPLKAECIAAYVKSIEPHN